MKTRNILTITLRLTVMFALVLLISSCQKTEKMQTFNDVFDTSGIEALNAQLVAAKTVADLPVELREAKIAVPEAFKNITLTEIAAWYKQNIVLTDVEVDMLLKNDSRTYIDVINRMGSFPPALSGVKGEDFKALKSSDLDKFLLKQVEEPENFYSTDYYSAVVAMQDYLKKAVIEPMDNDTNPPGKDDDVDHGIILFYKAISLNNVWDMWWTYWSDGTRTKHKGAAGTYPGPM